MVEPDRIRPGEDPARVIQAKDHPGVDVLGAPDAGMVLGLNYPRGILAWADAIGLDHVLSVLDGLYDERREERYRTAPLLRALAMSGRLGRQTGEGFFAYED